ncbi:hypothetical protein CHCC14810_0002 [Bacillus licheniformis]|nr:hypothetical protein CHCC15318_2982 [Bacillus licheniformis]TWM71217.1 hypothetical protein CHCC14810_0002 [Bacillus licheniformis]
MFDHHALRLARRSGCINVIGKISGFVGMYKVGGIFFFCIHRICGEYLIPFQRNLRAVFCKDDLCSAVFEQEANPLFRISGIDRYVHASCFQHRQHADGCFKRPLHHNGGGISVHQASCFQPSRELIGFLIQPAVSQASSVSGNSRFVRRRFNLFFKQLRNRLFSWITGFRLIKSEQRLLLLF